MLACLTSSKGICRRIVQREGCQPLKCLPNKWFPPFGLDKLVKVIQAEKKKQYPLLMVRDYGKHGDTYAQWGGSTYTVITRDPSNLRAMLSSNSKCNIASFCGLKEANVIPAFEVGSARHGCVRTLISDGIFTQDGSKWKASRKLLAPMIQRPTLPDLSLFERHFQQLHKSMCTSAGSLDMEPGINMKELLLDSSLKMMTKFLLGESADPAATTLEAAEWKKEFTTEFNTAFNWISKRERFKSFYWLIDGLQFRKSCSAAKMLVDELVCRAMELRKMEKPYSAPSETYVALESSLLHEPDPEPIRDQFMNLLLAGRDSSGSLLCWIFYALAREPQLAVDITEELENIVGLDKSRKPDKKQLDAMLKLDRFICEGEVSKSSDTMSLWQTADMFVVEVLRLFPPVPLNGRFSTCETYLPRGGGEHGEAPILIPRGTLVAFSTFATQRSQHSYGQDANKFRAERWDDDFIEGRITAGWSYHPFLGGPRKCLGGESTATCHVSHLRLLITLLLIERFAITQAKYLTCRMLQHYKQIIATDDAGNALAFRPDGLWVDDVKYDVGLTMMPEGGVWLRFVPRT